MPNALRWTAAAMAEPSFIELIERLQHNDRQSIDLLIERYGPALRRAIDRALFERRVTRCRQTVDENEASDIYQTVLLVFLARLERGCSGAGRRLGFETPGHLVSYLKAIAGNEINRRSRGSRALARIGEGRLATTRMQQGSDEPGLAQLAVSAELTPSESLMACELLEQDHATLAEIERRLRSDEKAIWELVRLNLSWSEIASRLEGSAEALRKRFCRAVRRIAAELEHLRLQDD
jgi:DNA-directed RNA polymerase specialized sigma24 family protein